MKKAMCILMLCILITITGCSSQEKGEAYFNAMVLEVNENYVLVEPLDGEEELKAADKIMVSTNVISTNEVPKMEEKTLIRVIYNGVIEESYPAKIKNVFAIYLIDKTGELLDNKE